jgi:hypothetical protein
MSRVRSARTTVKELRLWVLQVLVLPAVSTVTSAPSRNLSVPTAVRVVPGQERTMMTTTTAAATMATS